MFELIGKYFDVPGFFRLFDYVTFRALMASLTAMIVTFSFGNKTIRLLMGLNFRETIRDDGPSSHQSKKGTPSMGGILILGSITISCILFGNFNNFHFVLLLLFTLIFGMLGFWDDYAKIVLKKRKGINGKVKLAVSIFLALSFCSLYFLFTPEFLYTKGNIQYSLTSLFIPFQKVPLFTFPVIIAFFFWLIVITGSCHAVNLTDGLDGLAVGNVSIAASTLGVIAYLTGTPVAAAYLNLPVVENVHEISVFLAALVGAGIGFLWFNTPPARVFMGDTGSLALGSALGMTAIILKKEILLIITGGIFVIEAISVILQVASFKLRGKRIFKMAPIHHHFELKGCPETRLVVRFWLIGIILSLLSLSTIRLQ